MATDSVIDPGRYTLPAKRRHHPRDADTGYWIARARSPEIVIPQTETYGSESIYRGFIDLIPFVKELRDTQDGNSMLRARYINELELLQGECDLAEKSVVGLCETVFEMCLLIQARGTVFDFEWLPTMKGPTQDACTAMSRRWDVVKQLHLQLTHSETTTARLESAITSRYENLIAFKHDGEHAHLFRDDHISEPMPDAADQDEPLPPDAEEYFNKLSQVSLLEEDIDDLRYKHAEVLAQREFERDHDRSVTGTDNVVHQEYRSALLDVHQRLVSSVRTAMAARETCLINGVGVTALPWDVILDPNEYDDRSYLVTPAEKSDPERQSGLYSREHLTAQDKMDEYDGGSDLAATAEEADLEQQARDLVSDVHLSIHDKVESWRQDPPHAQTWPSTKPPALTSTHAFASGRGEIRPETWMRRQRLYAERPVRRCRSEPELELY